MPSSPLAPSSHPTRGLVDFVSSGRTLEWACAAAQLSGRCEDDEEATEEEEMEAITPEGSLREWNEA